MSYEIRRTCKWRLVVAVVSLIAAWFGLGVQSAFASNAPLILGSYEVVQVTPRGSLAQIRMRIHLVNHGPSDLSIQSITLWDFSHPACNGAHANTVTLRAHASAEATKEFTIARSEYQMWQKGQRPRLVLRMGGGGDVIRAAGAMQSTAVIRLDHIAGQEAK